MQSGGIDFLAFRPHAVPCFAMNILSPIAERWFPLSSVSSPWPLGSRQAGLLVVLGCRHQAASAQHYVRSGHVHQPRARPFDRRFRVRRSRLIGRRHAWPFFTMEYWSNSLACYILLNYYSHKKIYKYILEYAGDYAALEHRFYSYSYKKIYKYIHHC